jgi:hypothetical protein
VDRKLATTARVSLIVSGQAAAVPDAAQSPPQAISKPAAGTAFKLTGEPTAYSCVQSPGQSMPGPVTRPLPLTVTDKRRFAAGIDANVADTDLFVLMANVQVGAAPPQSPPQPVKVVPPTAAAVNRTLVPDAYCCVQSPGQSIPVPVTLPEPVTLTVSVRSPGGANAAETDLFELIARVQLAAVPLQSLPQPVKVWPAPGVAVS